MREPLDFGHRVEVAKPSVARGFGASLSKVFSPLFGRVDVRSPATVAPDNTDSQGMTGFEEIKRITRIIESTRDQDGRLSPVGHAMLSQLNSLTDAGAAIVGAQRGAAPATVGEDIVRQMNVLDQCIGSPSDPYSGLKGGIARLDQELAVSKMRVDGELSRAIDDLRDWTNMALPVIEDRVAQLTYFEQSIESSPANLANLYNAKADICQAAIDILNSAIREHGENPAQREILASAREQIVLRRNKLRDAATQNRGGLGQLKKMAGVKAGKIRSELYASWVAAKKLLANGTSLDVDTPQTNERSIVERALRKTFAKAGIRGDHVHDLAHVLSDLIDSKEAWRSPISTRIKLTTPADPLDGRSQSTIHTFKSEITPAPAVFNNSYGGRGVNSHRRTEDTHAVNLAHTRIEAEGGRNLFSAVRHGVVSAFGLVPKGVKSLPDNALGELVGRLLPVDRWMVDEQGRPSRSATVKAVRAGGPLLDQIRATANENRAKEIVALTVAMDSDLLKIANLAAEDGITPPTVDILSLSLLTPDSYRSLKSDVDDNERLMLTDQLAAWNALKTDPITLKVQVPGTDQVVDVKIKVNPVAMNYGVNQGAVVGFGPVSSDWDMASGWSMSSKVNLHGLDALFGTGVQDVGASRDGMLGSKIAVLDRSLLSASRELDRLRIQMMNRKGAETAPAATEQLQESINRHAEIVDTLRNKADIVKEIQRQIGEIHRDGAYRKAGNETYKMPTRLAVLAEMLGVKVAFNCKSGKDRTGELDAEIKHFKTQIELSGRVPDYRRVRDGREKDQFYEVMTQSGNFEMQRLNTGFAGYKLQNVDSLFRQFGEGKNDERTRVFHGLSSLTSS